MSAYPAATKQGQSGLMVGRPETANVSERVSCSRLQSAEVCCCDELLQPCRTFGPRPAPESDLAAWMARVECHFPSIFTPRGLILASNCYSEQQSLQARSALSTGLDMLILWYFSIRSRCPPDHTRIGAKFKYQRCFTIILRAILVYELPCTSKLYTTVSAGRRSWKDVNMAVPGRRTRQRT